MLDLRKRAILAVKVKPKDSKANDFHIALADYLYKELRHQGLNVKRNSVNLKIKLDKLHDDKYDCIVVDCIAGKLFLRGKEVKDKFFGKLRRFEGSRPADAYYCVVQSATRIANRVKRLINNLLDDNDEREIYAEEIERVDLRRKRIDMRKKAEITEMPSFTDIGDRQFALCYINGEIYFGKTHAECINEYLQKNFNDGLSNIWNRPNIIKDGLAEYIKECAFAHLINPSQIRLETDSLYNVDKNTVALALKKDYPNAVVYDNNRYDEIRDRYVKIADLRKNVMGADFNNRKRAIVYADGEIIEGKTHSECIDKYLREHNLGQLNELFYRPVLYIDNHEVGSDEYIIQQNIKSIGLAHLINDTEIRIATDYLFNLNLNTFVSALKSQYPGAEIYDDNKIDDRNRYFKKLADFQDVTSETDYADREKAIIYINGEILEGNFHAECIDKYLREHNLGQLANKQWRPSIFVKNPDVGSDEWIIQQNIKQLAFAHLINDYEIRLETDSLYNVDENTVALALKQKYSGCEIFDDNKYDSFRDKYKKIAKDLRKKAEFYSGENVQDKFLECYKNPTVSEFRELKKENSELRIMLLKDGTVYAWSGDLWHIYATSLFNIPEGIHLYTEDGVLNIDTINIKKEDLTEAFNNTISLFNGINKDMFLEFYGPYYDDYHFESIQEILDGEETTYNEWKNSIKEGRLKKGELIDAFRKRDEYIEVFRNPMASEIEGVKDPYYMGFKGAITKDGELYVWSVHIAHDDINDYIKTPIDVSYIRVYGENSILYISGNKDVDFEDLKIYLNKYTNLFTNRYQYNLYGFSNIGDYEIKTNEFQSINEILQVFN